jgi:hypothetical protein
MRIAMARRTPRSSSLTPFSLPVSAAAALRTSVAVISPCLPVASTVRRSTPRSAARRLTAGAAERRTVAGRSPAAAFGLGSASPAADRACIRRLPGAVFQQRCADLHDVARLGEKLDDLSGFRRRDFDYRLVRFHGHQWLVGADMVAGAHVPVQDFGLLQAFAEIGQAEDAHA